MSEEIIHKHELAISEIRKDIYNVTDIIKSLTTRLFAFHRRIAEVKKALLTQVGLPYVEPKRSSSLFMDQLENKINKETREEKKEKKIDKDENQTKEEEKETKQNEKLPIYIQLLFDKDSFLDEELAEKIINELKRQCFIQDKLPQSLGIFEKDFVQEGVKMNWDSVSLDMDKIIDDDKKILRYQTPHDVQKTFQNQMKWWKEFGISLGDYKFLFVPFVESKDNHIVPFFGSYWRPENKAALNELERQIDSWTSSEHKLILIDLRNSAS